MRIEAKGGASIRVETDETKVEIHVEKGVLTNTDRVVAFLDTNHGRAMAKAIIAACDELDARSVGG